MIFEEQKALVLNEEREKKKACRRSSVTEKMKCLMQSGERLPEEWTWCPTLLKNTLHLA